MHPQLYTGNNILLLDVQKQGPISDLTEADVARRLGLPSADLVGAEAAQTSAAEAAAYAALRGQCL